MSWARTVRDKSRINTRAETALKPGYLRRMLDRQRILIPATHFYEWQARSGGPRQPMLIAPRQADGLVFAGVLGKWRDESTGEVLPAVTILTTTPNRLLSGVHNRMPVILPASSWSRWPDSSATGGDVAELLKPCPTSGRRCNRSASVVAPHECRVGGRDHLRHQVADRDRAAGVVEALPAGRRGPGRGAACRRRIGHTYVERELVRFGARPRRQGEPGADWLRGAVSAAGVRSIVHYGNHRYAFRLGARRRLIAVGLPAAAYPKVAA